jgi:peptidoglycan hydrolase-like protein with peptidoglycan-binding domain
MIFQIAASLLVPALLLASTASHPAAKSKTTSSKTVTHKKTSATHTRKGRSTARRRTAGPSYQTRPTADRYKEVQQSLADKGYYKGEVNGTWGDDSTEALKHFQSDHKLADDGKLNSLSIIQLGLGPKHDSAAVHPGNAPDAALPGLPNVTEAPPDTPESQ